ncbi:MAG TPA: L,D-transpeptidase family protein [Gemmatimonadaceae bacterium]|nr:L,D-transpeptidase family protein [Gemmatimonadaceae bacterium]
MRRSSQLLFSFAILAAASPAVRAQQSLVIPGSDSLPVTVDSVPETGLIRSIASKVVAPVRLVRRFTSRSDRREYEAARALADRATGFRVVVDIGDHRLWVIDGNDTLRTAPVATAMNTTLSYGGKSWRFETPRGVRTVLFKDKEPRWTPPEWHFAEVATENGLRLRQLERGQVVRLRDGTRLTTRGDEVGVIQPGETEFVPLVLDEHVVFDNTLFIPPVGTKHRSVEGELGHYRLALGDGYMLHGTPNQKSIGTSATHGCVRLHDEDIEWLYQNVPVGTKVYLY